MWLTGVHTEVGSIIFIWLICACLNGIAFHRRILCRNFLKPLACVVSVVLSCHALKGKGRVRTRCCFGDTPPSTAVPSLRLWIYVGWMRASMLTSVLNMNKWFNFSFIFPPVIKNINKNPDTVFHTPRLILDSIHFGDRCCKTGLANSWLFLKHHDFRLQPLSFLPSYLIRPLVISFVLVLSYSFLCYLWPPSPLR